MTDNSTTSVNIEQLLAARAGYRNAGQGKPEEADKIIDVLISVHGTFIKGRVYIPKGSNAAAPLPVVLFYHGGCFIIGDIDTHDVMVRALANLSGAIFLSVDYRLAPEYPAPTPANDCFDALKWAAANAAEWGGDATRLAVCGDSAGGSLSAVVAQRAQQEGYPKLMAQALLYPMTDATLSQPSMQALADEAPVPRSFHEWAYSLYVPDEMHRGYIGVSPLLAQDLEGQPPAIVITAETDPLRDEGNAYATKLEEAGVAVKHLQYAGMRHGFAQYYQAASNQPAGPEAIDAVAAFLHEQLF